MQELGVWTTDTGTSEARLEFEHDTEKLPSWLPGAVSGAVTGFAVGGVPGLVIGGAAGALGAPSSATMPAAGSTPPVAPSMPAGAATQPTDPDRVRAVQALQQLAALMPILIQLVAAGPQRGKESGLGELVEGNESMEDSDWGPESFQGTWTLP